MQDNMIWYDIKSNVYIYIYTLYGFTYINVIKHDVMQYDIYIYIYVYVCIFVYNDLMYYHSVQDNLISSYQ